MFQKSVKNFPKFAFRYRAKKYTKREDSLFNSLDRLLFSIMHKALLLSQISSSTVLLCGFLWRKEVCLETLLITWRRRSVFAIFGLSSIKTTQENLSNNFLTRKRSFYRHQHRNLKLIQDSVHFLLDQETEKSHFIAEPSVKIAMSHCFENSWNALNCLHTHICLHL